MIPSEEIRKIYQQRKKRADKREYDEIDMLFGSCSQVEKSIIEYLDKTTFNPKTQIRLDNGEICNL
jgi:hypothetical protein